VSQPATPACLLIADDLTGACDAAIHFAMRGYRTVVSIEPAPDDCDADVLAISTESRGFDRDELRGVFADLGRAEWGGPRNMPSCRETGSGNARESKKKADREVRPTGPTDNRPTGIQAAAHFFKKIDSTLRGNVGAEVSLAAEAFGCDAALITPAFPAMGRTVDSGFLRVAGAGFAPIGMIAYWREQGLCGCAHLPVREVAAALEAGTRFVSADAASDSDLDAIAAAGLASARRILWAGSAGLA